MYKDKDKQREANAERQRRYKARHKGVTSGGVTSGGVTDKALPDDVVTSYCEFVESILPKRDKDIKCFTDLPLDEQEAMLEGGLVAVTGKPGDADYNGICTPEWRAERGR